MRDYWRPRGTSTASPARSNRAGWHARKRLVDRLTTGPTAGGSARLPRADLANATSIAAMALVGLLALAIVYTLYLARPLLIPFTAAILMGFLLKPLIRMLRRAGIPEVLGTIVVFIAFIVTMATAAYLLTPAATTWLSKLPENVEQAERRLRTVIRSFGAVREVVDEVANVSGGERREQVDVVTVAPQSLSDRLLDGTRSFAIGSASAAFLLFLLLASGETFLRRTISMLPTLSQKKRVVRISYGIERDLSMYLLTTSLINAGLGAVVGVALHFIGVPNPVLWGVVVALLNFVPYLGGITGVLTIGLVALASIEDTSRALLAPAAYFILNALEAYVITPHIVGRRFSLNPVAVFGAVFFWGWIWGIPGALLAVPILTATSIVCANIDRLRPIAVFLKA